MAALVAEDLIQQLGAEYVNRYPLVLVAVRA
jgi:hypothetical protein